MENPHTPANIRLDSLEKRQLALTEKLNRLQEQQDLETREEERMRIQNEVNKTKEALADVEKEIAILVVPSLIQKANHLKGVRNYSGAIGVWHEINTLEPNHPLAGLAISQLEIAESNHAQAVILKSQLSMHSKQLAPVWSDLMHKLKKANDSIEFQTLIEVTENYLSKKMQADDYVTWYEAAILTETEKQQTSYDLDGIAQRIKRGDMVLFLGSDIAKHYQTDCLNDQEVAQQLAKQVNYKTFNGSLSSIAEFCQARPEIGATQLLEHLQQHLPKDQKSISLYQHLAQTQVAQVLITSAYDDLLEQAFITANKPFVKLSSFIYKTHEYEMGHVKVHYSDNRHQDQILMEEELSKMRFIEQGYSVIYKIRGTCNKDDTEERDALILAERHFFDFARYARRIIPSNLAHEIRKRGFLFLGYRPRSWEDRLLVKTLLEKRQNADESCYVFASDTEPMEDAHWKQHKVERYPYDLSALDACFQQAEQGEST